MEIMDFYASCEDLLEIYHRLQGLLRRREIDRAAEPLEYTGECTDGPPECTPTMQTEKSRPDYLALETSLPAGSDDAMPLGQQL